MKNKSIVVLLKQQKKPQQNNFNKIKALQLFDI